MKTIYLIKGKIRWDKLTYGKKSNALAKNSQFTDLLILSEYNKIFKLVQHYLSCTKVIGLLKRGKQSKKLSTNVSYVGNMQWSQQNNWLRRFPEIASPTPPPTPTFSVTGTFYITLFTYAVTRCAHLELVSDPSNKNFVSLRRFLNRKKNYLDFYPDNANKNI